MDGIEVLHCGEQPRPTFTRRMVYAKAKSPYRCNYRSVLFGRRRATIRPLEPAKEPRFRDKSRGLQHTAPIDLKGWFELVLPFRSAVPATGGRLFQLWVRGDGYLGLATRECG